MGLAARGHHVELVVSKIHADIQREQPDARSFDIPASVPLHVLPSRRAMRNVFALGRLLRRIKPDVVVTCVGHYNQCAVLAKKLFYIKVPIIYIEHNMSRGGGCRGVRGSFARWCLRQEASIVAVSDGVKKCLEEMLQKADRPAIVRIYNPILDIPNVPCASPVIHPWLRQSPHPFTIVAAGALTGNRKGFDILIEAFRLFRLKHTESRLVIFGEGSDRDVLQRQIDAGRVSESVKLAGFTDCIVDNMRRADCFVHSARQEPFGIVIVEALAAGLPVVATDCPVGPREILKDGKLGQLVPVDDVQAMADALERVYLKKFSPAEAFSPEPYRYGHVIDEYEALLREVAG